MNHERGGPTRTVPRVQKKLGMAMPRNFAPKKKRNTATRGHHQHKKGSFKKDGKVGKTGCLGVFGWNVEVKRVGE